MASKVEKLVELGNMHGEPFLIADGYDDCILGYVGPKVVYDAEKVIQTLMDRDGMDYEEAVEFFGFNIEGAYVGEGTPIFMYLLEDDG
jgi:hypothetical protein